MNGLASTAQVGPIKVTLSIGLAMSDGEPRLERIMERADRALYAAKASGRITVSLDYNAA